MTTTHYMYEGVAPHILNWMPQWYSKKALRTTSQAWCFWDFTFKGHGTPAPIDPPKELVTTGLYRYVRNPIYVGALTIIIGHFLWFKTIWMLAYAVAVFLFFHLFVTLYEEPTVKRRFGVAYEKYCKTVPHWIPKLK